MRVSPLPDANGSMPAGITAGAVGALGAAGAAAAAGVIAGAQALKSAAIPNRDSGNARLTMAPMPGFGLACP
jgi:hypothetical protein